MKQTTTLSHLGYVFQVTPEAADWLPPEVLPRLESLAAVEGSRVIKSNNARTVYRVPFSREVLFVKLYHVRGLPEKLKYLVVPSRAGAEWRAARAMKAAGLPTVTALMMGEKRRFRVLQGASLALVEIPGCLELVPWIKEHCLADRPDHETRRQALLRSLARLVRDFHDKGFSHQDLHSGNLLVQNRKQDPDIFFIDLHKVRVGRSVTRTRRHKNLAKLMLSLSEVTGDADLSLVVDAYEGRRPVLGERETVLSALCHRVEGLKQRGLRSRSRRCLKNSSQFRVTRNLTRKLFLRRDMPEETALELLKAHKETIATPGETVLNMSRRSVITKQQIDHDGERLRVVVKENLCRSWLDCVKNLFRRPRGVSSWVHGNGLIVRGVDVARPLAAVVEYRGLMRRRSWLIMEDLNDFVRLDRFVHGIEQTADKDISRQDKRALIEDLAGYLRGLHRLGTYHGDMKDKNVYVRKGGRGHHEFKLIDYDRVYFGHHVPRRRRIKNIAQLASSISLLADSQDRRCFLERYAFDADIADNMDIYDAGIVAECGRRGGTTS